MDNIFLSVKELAVKLHVSEKTIYRMINDNKIPYGIKIGGQWRFNSDKINKWVQQSAGAKSENKADHGITVAGSITDSTIIYKLCGGNRDEVLDQLLSILNQFTDEEILSIKKSILYKESIISSSFDGISVMTADHGLNINLSKSVFAVAYLDSPLDFRAIDGKITSIVIMIIPANRTEQLILGMRLRGLLTNQDFIKGLRKEPNRSSLIKFISEYEDRIFPE